MAKVKIQALNERLVCVREELAHTRAALMRSVARNAELRQATVELCRRLKAISGHTRRTLPRPAETDPVGRRVIETATYGLARGLASGRMRRVIEYIEASLAERLDVATLASVAGMSTAHFATRFKQATGLPPHEAVIRLRLARSKELLADESQTIAAISAELGFSSQAHFTTVFRQRFGVTPAGWRETRLRPLQRNQSWPSLISQDARTRSKNSESHGNAAHGLMGVVSDAPHVETGASRPGPA